MRRPILALFLVIVLCASHDNLFAQKKNKTKYEAHGYTIIEYTDPKYEPVIIDPVIPEYPAKAKRRKLSGWVAANLLINKTGGVDTVEVGSASDPIFITSATNALKGSHFVPFILDGVPMKARFSTRVEFKLSDEGKNISSLVSEAYLKRHKSKPVVEPDTSTRDVFVDIQDEPRIILPLNSIYPESAKLFGIEGKVVCDVLIGKDGKVEKVDITRASDSIFIQPARDALMKAHFIPAKQNKMPVRVWWTVPLFFKITSDSTQEVTTTMPYGKMIVSSPFDHDTVNTEWPRSTIDNYKPITYSGPQMRYNINRYLAYPEEAKQRGIGGMVMLSVLINTNGLVEDVKLKETTDSIFIQSAINAMQQMMFYPPTENDQPVRKWWDVPVEFNVNQNR